MNEFQYHANTEEKSDSTPVLYIQRQIFKIPGTTIRVFDSHKRLLAKASALPFKLREKIRLYSDEEKTTVLSTAQAKKIIDFNVTFEIRSGEDGGVIGSMRRKGWRSELGSDSWLIFNNKEQEIAALIEPNMRYSVMRKWLLPFLPQTYRLELSDKSASLTIKQEPIPWVLRYRVYSEDFSAFKTQIPEKFLTSILCTIAVIERRE